MDPDPGYGFPIQIRIRIHKYIASRSNPDPDPQPWMIHFLTEIIDLNQFFEILIFCHFFEPMNMLQFTDGPS
jgi:hypothetical protein